LLLSGRSGLREAVTLITLEQAAVALDVIGVDCSADERQRVALGLYAAFGEAGRPHWRRWIERRAPLDVTEDEALWGLARCVQASMVRPFVWLACGDLDHRAPAPQAPRGASASPHCSKALARHAAELASGVPPLALDDAAFVLSFIDPNCSTDARQCVARGLCAALGDSGRRLWLRWAAGRSRPDRAADEREWCMACGVQAMFVVSFLQLAYQASPRTPPAEESPAAAMAKAAIDRARRSARRA
jgi:hypothetical protein